MRRRSIRWTNCQPIKLRRGALDVLVAALRIAPSRLPSELILEECWQAVVSNLRAEPTSAHGYVPAATPALTIGQL